jgi:glycosyltransferase involved in cell wall biosynthesis
MYNEGAMIASVVKEVRLTFAHVVCIDDGSRDDSAAAARAAGAVVIEHPINLGQGASLQTGFEFALGDPAMTEIVTFDAVGQHLVSDARDMVSRLSDEKLDVVIGSRFLDDRTQVGWAKRFVLRTAARYTRMTTGLPLTDAHNGLRVIGRELLLRIELRQNRMAHASELVDQISALKARWAEHPTHIVYTDYSRAKGQSLLNSVNILVDLMFR